MKTLKCTKKQLIIGGSVVILLVGAVTVGTVASAHHHQEEKKAEQIQKEKDEKANKLEKAKKLEKSREADAKRLLRLTEKSPSTKNLSLSEIAISKVENKEIQKTFNNELTSIKNRLKLEDSAKQAVASYQKDAMNTDKMKAAKQAIDKLTSPYSKTLKTKLTKQFNLSKKQADDAKKIAAKKQKTVSSKGTPTSNVGSSSSHSSAGTSQNASASQPTNGNSGNSSANHTGNNTGSNTGGNTNNNDNTPDSTPDNKPTPKPKYKYLGWFSIDGVRKYTKLCDTVAECHAWLDMMNQSQEIIDQGFDHSISYGLDTVEV